MVPNLQAGLGQLYGQMGGAENTYAQQLQNQIAQANVNAMQLPMNRIQQAANIFGTTAGQVPGAPVQPFQVNPMYAGIGAFGNLQAMLGAKSG